MKKFWGIISLLAICLIMTACNNSTGTSSSGKIRLRFASWDSNEDLKKQQELVDRFNQNQDNVEVVMEAYGDDYDTKIAAGMGTGDAPDIMYMWNYPAYYEALEPLDSYIEKEASEYKDNFYETLWSYNSIDGQIYGMPVGYTTHALYYNKDLFDAAGISYPEENWTFTDMETAARALTNDAENTKGFVFKRCPDPYDFEMFLWSNGGTFSDESGELKGNINSEASIDVFTKFQNMEKEGIAIAADKDGTTDMLTGKVGMYINGAWPISQFDSAGLNYGITKIPMMQAGKDSVSILSSSGLSMSKDSKNKEAAWEFIKYWTGEEMNVARIEYELPVLKSVVESEQLNGNEKKGVFFDMLEQSSGYTPSSFKIDDWSNVSEKLELAFERIFNASVYDDPKTVLDEMAQ